MKISQVQVTLVEDSHVLRAVANVVLDGVFVVHGIRVIQSKDGRLFASMPSRKAKANCPGCGAGNEYDARVCNDCGRRLPGGLDLAARRMHTDLAHPITAEFRARLEEAVLRAVAQAARP